MLIILRVVVLVMVMVTGRLRNAQGGSETLREADDGDDDGDVDVDDDGDDVDNDDVGDDER